MTPILIQLLLFACSACSIYSSSYQNSGWKGSSSRDTIFTSESSKSDIKDREQLYEAYNLLHTLAQVIYVFTSFYLI